MVKSFTSKEFINYVDNLEFEELEDAAAFVRLYYDEYLKAETEEDKDSTFMRYTILMSKFGIMFLTFTEMVVKLRKETEARIDDVKKEQNTNSSI